MMTGESPDGPEECLDPEGYRERLRYWENMSNRYFPSWSGVGMDFSGFGKGKKGRGGRGKRRRR
ncbi:MAG: hypothetical protein ACP6IP_04285 [Candidatus Njordarchaeia archaeon]